MRILLATHQFFPDHFAGTEVAARDTGLELRRRGHDVHVLTVDPVPDHEGAAITLHDYVYEGLKVHAVRIPDHVAIREPGAEPVRLEYADEAVAGVVRELLRELAPDVVHAFHLARLTGSTLHAMRELQVPLVFTATDFWPVCVRTTLLRPGGELCYGPNEDSSNCLECRRADRWFGVEPPARLKRRQRLYRRIAAGAMAAEGTDDARAATVRAVLERRHYLRRSFERVDAILAPTALMRDVLIANGLPADLIRVHPYSLDLSRFREVRDSRARSGRGVRFAYIGRIGRPKGIHILIRAFRRLLDPNATLEIVGEVGAEHDYFRQLYELAAGDERIRFAGGVPNERIPERLRRVDVQVVPSVWHENAPLTISSAQAAGVPVVASRVGGMTELIIDGENGLLFEPADVADLAVKLESLIASPELIERLAGEARQPLSAAEGVDVLLSLYEEIRSRPPGTANRAIRFNGDRHLGPHMRVAEQARVGSDYERAAPW